MLTWRNLVVRRFDVKTHLLEHEDDFAGDILSQIARGQVEVAA